MNQMITLYYFCSDLMCFVNIPISVSKAEIRNMNILYWPNIIGHTRNLSSVHKFSVHTNNKVISHRS